MSKAVIRFLKVLSIIVWLSVTLLGFIVFYNLSHIQYSFGEPQTQTEGSKLNITIAITITYNGYVLPVHVRIEFRVETAQDRVLDKDVIDVILKPGQSGSYELRLHINDLTQIDHGRIFISVAQLLVSNVELISLTMEETVSMSVGG